MSAASGGPAAALANALTDTSRLVALHANFWQKLSARRQQLPHALLFAGPRGVGKFALAQAFAAALLCEAPQDGGLACGKCAACNWQMKGNHPDFRLLRPLAMLQEEARARGEAPEDAEKGGKKASREIVVDQVRELDDFLHVGTHRAGRRVIVICPAEAMNRNTANSLLKVLEEPAGDTVFILVSDEANRLLPTIRSRCQSLALALPDPAAAAAFLAAAGVADARRWLRLAGGAPLLAAELAASGEKQLIDALIGALASGAGLDAISAAGKLDAALKTASAASGQPLKRLIEWAQKWLLDLALATANRPARYFADEAARLVALAGRTSQRAVLGFARQTLQYRLHATHPLNQRLFLEDFLLAYVGIFQEHPARRAP